MIAAIEEHLLPLGVQMPNQAANGVFGGFFLWLTLPAQLLATQVAEAAARHESLIVAPGHLFEIPGDAATASFPRQLRLCFAWEPERLLVEAVIRLRRVILAIL